MPEEPVPDPDRTPLSGADPGEGIPETILSPRLLAATDGEVSSRRVELRRVAAATRALIEGLVGTDASEALIAETADELERLVAPFTSDHPRSIYDGVSESAMAGAEPDAFFDHSPIIGRANPLSPPVTLEMVDDVVQATVTFGSAYEGPPGCVHGGYVAAAFDEVLGAAQTVSGSPGMTGTLIVRYRSPTPLHTALRIEGELDRTEGRKVFTVGRMFAGDVLTAEAEAIFVSIGPERFQKLREERDARFA